MTNWQEVRLDDICKINTETYSLDENLKYVNYLDTGNITSNRIENIQYIDLYVDKLPSRARRKVKNGNIIYSTVRPNQLHYGLIKEQPDNFLVSTGFAVLDIDTKKAIPEYVYYSLTQTIHTEALQAIAEQSTSAYPSIKSSDIGNRIIPLPPLDVQKKIAGVLGALDDKIELNNRINNNLEQQAQALFKSWFVDFEPFGGTMPKDWKIGNLLDIADYLNGLAMQKFRPAENDKGLQVLKIKELRQGFCDSNSELCSLNVKNEYIVNDGDVIFSWSGSLLVDFWCGGKCGLNQHLFKVTSKNFDKWFYFLWTKHYLEHFAFIAADKATTMGHIKREELEKAKVVIPSSDCYQKMNQIMTPIYDLLISNRIENNRLIQLRDTLLPKLMSGKIDVSKVDINELNAADELS